MTASIWNPVSTITGISESVESIAELRQITATLATVLGLTAVVVKGYYSAGDGGGGIYYLDSTDTTTADNGGTVIVANDARRWKLLKNKKVSVRQFGAKGDGITDDTAKIQAAINACEVVYFSAGTYNFSLLTPKSNVTLEGPVTAILSQQQPITNIVGGIYHAAGSGNLINFHVKGLTFNGNRIANPANVNNNLFWIDIGANDIVSNISGEDSIYIDVQNTFWYFSTSNGVGTANNLRFTKNTVITTSAKRNLAGNIYIVAQDFVRFENVPTNPGSAPWGYGTICFRDLDVSHNYAESIRTLADFKRGCADFVCVGNTTRNMDDCHISVDGSFNGVIANNTGSILNGYAYAASQNNFIEIQGEEILVLGNTFDGGNEVNSGIQITDYHLSQELDGVNPLGRVSRGIIVQNNTVKNVLVNAYRLINAADSSLINNYCENIGGHTATIEAPANTYNGSGSILFPSNCRISGIKSKGAATTGVYIAGGTGHSIGANINEYGQELFDVTSSVLFSREGSHSDLNVNPALKITGAGANNIDLFATDVYPAAALAATYPNNAAQAIRITDANAASLVGHYIGAQIPAIQNSRLYFRLHVLLGTAPTCGILIQEFTSGGVFISNSFIDLAPTGTWTEKLKLYIVSATNCAYVRVALLPAAGSNIVANVGYSDVADFRVSRQVIGMR